MMKPTVCIDFNGVLDEYTGWVEGGVGTEYPPRYGASAFLEQLHSYYTVVILTAIRPVHVRQWLQRWDMLEWVDDVTNIKPPATAYIDDRAICFDGDYGQVMEQLATFRPYWKNVK